MGLRQTERQTHRQTDRVTCSGASPLTYELLRSVSETRYSYPSHQPFNRTENKGEENYLLPKE